MKAILVAAMALALQVPRVAASEPGMTDLGSSLVERLESGQDVEELQRAILARAKKEKPAVPEEARRRLARGRAAMKLAKSKEDYAEAVRKFQEALAQAPWLAEAYFNLGIAQEKAELYAQALRSFKGYLRAAPGASDADKVRERIYEIEFGLERQSRNAESQTMAGDVSLTGSWRDKNTGEVFRVVAGGSEFRADCADCGMARGMAMVFAGAILDRTIEGTAVTKGFSFRQCRFPDHSESMSGTISQDGRSITLVYKRVGWNSREWSGGLFKQPGCETWIQLKQSVVTTLVR